MLERGQDREEKIPDFEEVIDLVRAPIVYRIRFEPDERPVELVPH